VLGDRLHDEDLVAPPHGHDIVGNGQRLEKLADQRILALLGFALQIGGLSRFALGRRLVVVILVTDAQWGFAFAFARVFFLFLGWLLVCRFAGLLLGLLLFLPGRFASILLGLARGVFLLLFLPGLGVVRRRQNYRHCDK